MSKLMSGTANVGPTSEDIEQAVHLLAQLEPGKLPLGIFLEIARLTVTAIVEIVPLRTSKDGKIHVLLIEREADDPVWGGMLHTPGTVVRASDNPGSNDDAFSRILDGELKGAAVSEPVFVESILHRVKRGMEQAQIYYAEVVGEPVVGQFYDVDSLPKNIVDSQLEFISHAVSAYRNSLG